MAGNPTKNRVALGKLRDKCRYPIEGMLFGVLLSVLYVLADLSGKLQGKRVALSALQGAPIALFGILSLVHPMLYNLVPSSLVTASFLGCLSLFSSVSIPVSTPYLLPILSFIQLSSLSTCLYLLYPHSKNFTLFVFIIITSLSIALSSHFNLHSSSIPIFVYSATLAHAIVISTSEQAQRSLKPSGERKAKKQ